MRDPNHWISLKRYEKELDELFGRTSISASYKFLEGQGLNQITLLLSQYLFLLSPPP